MPNEPEPEIIEEYTVKRKTPWEDVVSLFFIFALVMTVILIFAAGDGGVELFPLVILLFLSLPITLLALGKSIGKRLLGLWRRK